MKGFGPSLLLQNEKRPAFCPRTGSRPFFVILNLQRGFTEGRNNSTYAVNFLQMFLATVMLNLLGIVALTAITLFLSAQMGSPVFTLIVSCIVCFLPVLFDFSDSLPILQKAQEICPIFMLHINGVFASMKTYLGFLQPAVMGLFNSVLIAVFYALTKSTFQRHQVTG